MKLLIHFGIYKAGSSYLQHICASKRDYLIANNIYFPESKEDQKMKKGLISKGNADGLDSAFKKEDPSKISKILQQWWVNNVYETPKLLENLASVIINNQDIKWTLRKFKKDSNFLKQAFFKDWLEIEVPEFQTRPNVNESISLSEVKVMNHIRKIYPNVTDYFYEGFKNLPKKDKADDKDLDAYVLSSFAKNLAQHDKNIQNINTYFAKNEQLVVGEFKNTDIDEPTMKLSDSQISYLFKRIQYFKTVEGKITKLRRRVIGFARRFLIIKLS